MEKKYCLFILFLFIVSVCLFSGALREESFSVFNFTDKELIINFEIFDYPEKPWFLDMYGINVWITWINGGLNADERTAEGIITPGDEQIIITYLPYYDWDEMEYYFEKLGEFSLYEKMMLIFRTFSIRTIEGEYIIRDIDDLRNAAVIKYNYSYYLKIYDE
jgi:hypothetical protein